MWTTSPLTEPSRHKPAARWRIHHNPKKDVGNPPDEKERWGGWGGGACQYSDTDAQTLTSLVPYDKFINYHVRNRMSRVGKRDYQ